MIPFTKIPRKSQIHRSRKGFPGGSDGKESAYNAGDTRDMGQEHPLEEEMGTHSGILAWRILWTEEFSRLQPMGSQRVGHN